MIVNASDTYRTDAHALHALVTLVNSQPHNQGLHKAWSVVLGADPNSHEFVVRHTEVVGLLRRTIAQIQVLPATSQANYEQWVPMWWRAVVSPDEAWGNGTSKHIIQPAHLSLLHSLGDVVEGVLDRSGQAPDGKNIDALAAAIETWTNDLATDPSLLPDNVLRRTIVQQLQHVSWLIENRGTFGNAPVAEAAQSVVGAAALAVQKVPVDKRAKWQSLAVNLIGSIAIFNGAVEQSAQAIENASDIVMGSIEAGKDAVDITSDIIDKARDD